MQSGQVSVWVPIVVGIIGLIGVIAGQLINSRREDKRWIREKGREELRWQREKDREELRWQREKEGEELRREREKESEELQWERDRFSETLKLRHENILQWRDTRIRVYGRLLKLLQDLVDVTRKMANTNRWDTVSELLQQFDQLRTVVTEAGGEAEVICSQEVLEHLQNYPFLFLFARPMPPAPSVIRNDPDEGKLTDGQRERLRNNHDKALTFYRTLTDLVRAELGVEHRASSSLTDSREQ